MKKYIQNTKWIAPGHVIRCSIHPKQTFSPTGKCPDCERDNLDRIKNYDKEKIKKASE